MKLNRLLLFFFFIYPLSIYADFQEGGEAYINGDYETAANEFIPLAERGDHRAMYALGSMYSEGHGVEKDLEKSFKLFSEAAKNGRADAMYKLGLMYEKGQGINQNAKKAIRHYKKSAIKGYPLAQYRFGLMYEKGSGVKQSLINAYAWLVIAGHYFIYDTFNSESTVNKSIDDKKRQLLFFHQEEKDRVFDEITTHLQNIKQDMSDEDIEKVKIKVINLSKYRKHHHPKQIKDLKIESSIESLFLPETLY
jgi:Sel1 repeat-containing protein